MAVQCILLRLPGGQDVGANRSMPQREYVVALSSNQVELMSEYRLRKRQFNLVWAWASNKSHRIIRGVGSNASRLATKKCDLRLHQTSKKRGTDRKGRA